MHIIMKKANAKDNKRRQIDAKTLLTRIQDVNAELQYRLRAYFISLLLCKSA